MPPDRIPASYYVHVSTPYGQYNTTTVKAAIADHSVSWNDTLTIHEHPRTFSKWLISIFKSKALLEERQLTFNSDVTNQRVSLKLQVLGDTDESMNGQPAHASAAALSSVIPAPPASSSRREQTHPREKNIVIFGETGSGKSSVINVIAQQNVAETSNDSVGRTSESRPYSVDISGQRFALFDTAGLNEGPAGTVPHKQAKRQLRNLLDKLHKSPSDDIDLLMYCVRKSTSPRAILDTYKTFYSRTYQKKKVPIVVVVTGLEFESPMESWWDAHKKIFDDMHLAGHACVTTIQEYEGIPEEFTLRVAESGTILRDLIVDVCSAPTVDGNLPVGMWCWPLRTVANTTAHQ
ncbi:P-loop containing nucleoside triphosphate hydrolase protein [Suillus spraguei]|nr:P-loop containing nucleoside triphosphate hydrolase protein [Suillus spraguei]